MSLEEKLDWAERAGGTYTVLEPGESIYFLMLMWHHLEYMDDVMSFDYRFRSLRYGRFLSVDNFHRDPYIQNVAAKMVGPDDVLSGFEPVVDEIAAAYPRAGHRRPGQRPSATCGRCSGGCVRTSRPRLTRRPLARWTGRRSRSPGSLRATT